MIADFAALPNLPDDEGYTEAFHSLLIQINGAVYVGDKNMTLYKLVQWMRSDPGKANELFDVLLDPTIPNQPSDNDHMESYRKLSEETYARAN